MLAELRDSDTSTKHTRLAVGHWQIFHQEGQVTTPIQEMVTAFKCEKERCNAVTAAQETQ